MKDRYQTIIDSQKQWEADRPVMVRHNEDLVALWILLSDEVTEAAVEVEALEKERSPYLVDKLAKELDDIFLFLLQMYSKIGVDLYQSVMDKRAINHARYTSRGMSNGRTYEEARAHDKGWFKARSMDKQWNEVDMSGQPFMIYERASASV